MHIKVDKGSAACLLVMSGSWRPVRFNQIFLVNRSNQFTIDRNSSCLNYWVYKRAWHEINQYPELSYSNSTLTELLWARAEQWIDWACVCLHRKPRKGFERHLLAESESVSRLFQISKSNLDKNYKNLMLHVCNAGFLSF